MPGPSNRTTCCLSVSRIMIYNSSNNFNPLDPGALWPTCRPTSGHSAYFCYFCDDSWVCSFRTWPPWTFHPLTVMDIVQSLHLVTPMFHGLQGALIKDFSWSTSTYPRRLKFHIQKDPHLYRLYWFPVLNSYLIFCYFSEGVVRCEKGTSGLLSSDQFFLYLNGRTPQENFDEMKAT